MWIVAAIAMGALVAGLAILAVALRSARRQLATRDRRMDTTLRETEERFRLIAETVTEVFWMADVTIERMVYISPGYERVFGRSCESLYRQPKSFIEAIYPDDLARVLDDYAKRKQHGAAFEHEYRIRRPDGSIRWIWDRGFPVRNDLGETLHYVGVAQDVTERRLVERELRTLAERFDLVCKATTDGIWDWDVATNVAWWSETFFATFGVDRATPPSYEAWAARIHPDDRARVLASFESILNDGRDSWTCEYRFRHGDGTWREVFDRAYVLFDSEHKPSRVLGATMDITDRRALDVQLRHAQKMEAVGQLAGGIAHDFNNILQAILIESQLLQQHALPPDAAALVADIRACADRAGTLTRRLRLFGRQEAMRFEQLDLNDLVRSLTDVLRRTLGAHIDVKLQLVDAPVIVHADRGMIDQVLLNLALNGRDAMPEGGELSIATSVVQRGGVGHVCIEVRDTGCGISPEVLPRIFEPFFTTKQSGEGTGLGLASSFGIVEQHRGVLEVESVVGRGATFRMVLPISSSHRDLGVDAMARPWRGHEKILVVEDDDALRATIRLILEQHGYRVCDAANGTDALDRFDECKPIDLVLIDLVIPGGVDGGELATRLEVRQPALKVVFTSGYDLEVTKQQLHLGDHRTFVHKPVAPEMLLATVRTFLDRS